MLILTSKPPERGGETDIVVCVLWGVVGVVVVLVLVVMVCLAFTV